MFSGVCGWMLVLLATSITIESERSHLTSCQITVKCETIKMNAIKWHKMTFDERITIWIILRFAYVYFSVSSSRIISKEWFSARLRYSWEHFGQVEQIGAVFSEQNTENFFQLISFHRRYKFFVNLFSTKRVRKVMSVVLSLLCSSSNKRKHNSF